MTFKRWKTSYKRNMIEEIRSFLLLRLKNEVAASLLPSCRRGKKLSWGGAERQNKCSSTRGTFLTMTQQQQQIRKKESDMTLVVTLEIDLRQFCITFSLSLITFDRAAARTDIKVDGVAKSLQCWGHLQGHSLSHISTRLPLFIYIKALKPSHPATSTKL